MLRKNSQNLPVLLLTKAGFSAIILRLNSFSAYANMAQVVEQLTRNEQVEGSSPSIGSLFMGVSGAQEAQHIALRCGMGQ